MPFWFTVRQTPEQAAKIAAERLSEEERHHMAVLYCAEPCYNCGDCAAIRQSAFGDYWAYCLYCGIATDSYKTTEEAAAAWSRCDTPFITSRIKDKEAADGKPAE